jgi:hypothetical protein
MVRPQAAPRNRSWRLRSCSSGAGWVGSDRIAGFPLQHERVALRGSASGHPLAHDL